MRKPAIGFSVLKSASLFSTSSPPGTFARYSFIFFLREIVHIIFSAIIPTAHTSRMLPINTLCVITSAAHTITPDARSTVIPF